MTKPLKTAIALLILGSLAGCVTPVGVREVDLGSVREVLSANVISAGEPSITSSQVMLRLGLGESFRRDPEDTLEALHDLTMQEMASDRLFALSEFSYLHATALDRACKRARVEQRRRRTYRGRMRHLHQSAQEPGPITLQRLFMPSRSCFPTIRTNVQVPSTPACASL